MFNFRSFADFMMLGLAMICGRSALLAAQEQNPTAQSAPANQPAKLTPAQCYQRIWQDVQSQILPNAPAQWDKFKDRQPKTAAELREMLQEAFAAANNPSLKLLTPSDVANLTSARAGGYPGIGVSTEFGAVVTSGVKLVKVFEDSPAAEAGLQQSDLITHINGAPIAGWSLLQVSLSLKGVGGTTVVLTVNRAGVIDNFAVERGVDGKLGVEVEGESPRHQFVVTDVQKDTPAARAGIKVGDIFVAVDGEKQCDIAFYFDPKETPEQHAAMVAKNARSLASPAMFIRFSSDGKLGGTIKLDMCSSGKAYSSTLTREPIPHSSQKVLHASSMHSGAQGKRLGWTQFQINNLDWTGLIADLDNSLQEAQKLPGLILDLRGTGGSDPQIAAELVARFVQGQAIFGVTRLNDAKEDATYIPDNAPPVVYSGNLEVLVDEQTTGTAQAVASALRLSHRARIRGQATKEPSALPVQLNYQIDDGSQVSVLIPALNLAKDSNGNNLTAVTPDYSGAVSKEAGTESSFFDEVSRSAQAAVDPGDPTDYGVIALALGILAAVVAVIVLVIWLAGRVYMFAVRRSALLQRIEQNPKTIWVVTAVALLLLGTVVFLLQPPSSAKAVRGEVVVKLFLDDSLLSKTQLKVAQQLEKEYSGPIHFVVIEANKAKDEESPPSSLPNVQVWERWYNADGTCISSGSHSGGPLTKAEMVESIQRSIDQPYRGCEKLPIVRQKP